MIIALAGAPPNALLLSMRRRRFSFPPLPRRNTEKGGSPFLVPSSIPIPSVLYMHLIPFPRVSLSSQSNHALASGEVNISKRSSHKTQKNFAQGRENRIRNLPSPASKPALSTPSACPPPPPPHPAPPPPTSTFGPAYAKIAVAFAPYPPHCYLPGHCHECRSAAARAQGYK